MDALGGGGGFMPQRLAADRRRLGVAMVLVLALGVTATAQQVLFVSDRYDPRTVRQSDVYLYDDGSTLRLSDTPAWAEYDPAPSPGGDAFAVAATNFLFPITSYDDAWSWRYVVFDDEGRQQDAWSIDGSTGMFRPAGGFQIAWLPDGRSFLANAYDEFGDWQVRRYVVDSRQTILLGPGYEIAVHPDGERFATSHNGIISLVEIASGERRVFAGGRPLAWTPDGTELLFEQAGALYRATEESPARRRVVGDGGPYVALRFAPDGGRYAVASVAGSGSSVAFYAATHELIDRWPLAASVVAFDWLDDEWLVLEIADAAGLRLELLAVDGSRAPFLDSFGDDASPRTLR